MVQKSDAMKTHEKWIEEALKQKPKKREGLPVQPWMGLAALLAIMMIILIISEMIH